MLARQSQLRHPTGSIVQTPLLVPSFSSKGSGRRRRRNADGTHGTVFEVEEVLGAASEFLTDSMLISAYDVHHGRIPRPERAVTEITILDSGGYETSDAQDLSTAFVHPVNPEPWDLARYASVLGVWPAHIPAMFVSYDNSAERLPLQAQIDVARSLFARFPGHLRTFLLKPETEDQQYLPIPEVISHAHQFSSFDVLGATEKELGSSFLKRMENIAKLRVALDEAGVQAPLHVFGGLDPISVPLYFFAGAEIFDGLTWLRYGYDGGCALYSQNFAVRRIGIDRRDDFIKMKTMQDNLGALTDLTNQMRRFLIDLSFAKFGPNSELFSEAFDLLKTRYGRAS